MRGWCPVCDELRHIATTGIPIGSGGTACRWLVDEHVDRRDGVCACGAALPCPEHGRPMCRGSGRRI